MKGHWAWVAAAGFLGAACGQEPDLSNIACSAADDATCPTGFWCQQIGPNNTCVDASQDAPPSLSFDGAGVQKGSYGTSVSVSAALTWLYVSITNHSTSIANEPTVSFSAPQCLHCDTSLRVVQIPAGATDEDFITVFPDPGCASPATVQVEIGLEGRTFVGAFQVTVQ